MTPYSGNSSNSSNSNPASDSSDDGESIGSMVSFVFSLYVGLTLVFVLFLEKNKFVIPF